MRYLTKSKFNLSIECPTKLYYSSIIEYASLKESNEFLHALAEGGYQVAELAKCYYRDRDQDHDDLQGIDNEVALIKTSELLNKDSIIIFEAAIKYENLFLRADILVKRHNSIKLIEIKSKSYDISKPFIGKKGGIDSNWRPYLYDIAFQKYVLQKALPDKNIAAYLMLVDKSVICPTDGLNQKFKINKTESGGIKIIKSQNTTDEDLSVRLIKEFSVDDIIQKIFVDEKIYNGMSFDEFIKFISSFFSEDQKIPPILGSKCRDCEFKIVNEDQVIGLKSGFKECWREVAGFSEEDFKQPTVLDVWDLRSKDKLIPQGVYKMSQLTEEDINPAPDGDTGFSRRERQWIQIKKVKNNDDSVEMDKVGLQSEINNWVFPFHFIDFETTRVPIPFHKGHRPNHGIAFQFSHHILYENGVIEHAGQYINSQIGYHPNIDFVRELRKQLIVDNGTIFMYSNHENAFLNEICLEMLSSSEDISDKSDLLNFIKSITKSKNDSKEKWVGERCMVDLLEVVKRYYYDPLTNGSNSIKKVFPAILKRSEFLRKKYSRPIYGTVNGIKSLNFSNKAWLLEKDGIIVDPYSQLDPIFPDMNCSEDDLERLLDADQLKDGSGAMIAYARMQFTEMCDIERQAIVNALLRYCELDTLAMVMIVEAWLAILKKPNN